MAGNTLTVACKLPHGLVLQNSRAIMDGKKVLKWIKEGPEVVIKGCATHVGQPITKEIASGFALTHGVDAEFFRTWIEHHAEFPAVKEGLIFAYETAEAVAGEAKDKAELESGFEPLDPDKMPAEFSAPGETVEKVA
jgi:hypothetical protein